MLTKILIANRGAIACRIIRTLKRLGIQSVAVYSEADRYSPHVRMADEAVCIGPGPAAQSYLQGSVILAAAKSTGAQGIHPGYGFLSENAEFARACENAEITWIGPSPSAMEVFGPKHSARGIARHLGIPLLPGTELLSDLEEAVRAAKEITYPVMLKATAGGGGIGMRVCQNESELRAAYEAVVNLGKNNFKDGGVFVERFVERSRHIEVQIFGNRFGEAVALGERDCSAQRRNQKVIEESPAPNLPEVVRQSMHASAVVLTKGAAYRSAGTIEFLYDENREEFYFLEVNTRLQVEHGVTEEVFGIDLVEWMVREASDELRDLHLLIRKPQGHSMQARIYAEDPGKSFAPSAGVLDMVSFPEGVRVESWVETGTEVSGFYDPMLAKLIVHAPSRSEAVTLLHKALGNTKLYGIATNVKWLQHILSEPLMQAGHVYTQWLQSLDIPSSCVEILDGGTMTTVQDYPGRVGYWDVGVPPCGPMDDYSFRLGNILLGNLEGAPGLEMTLRGATLKFRTQTTICLAGAEMKAELNGKSLPWLTPVSVSASDVLRIGNLVNAGMRSYLLVSGGFDVAAYLGSFSTFTLGNFGGHAGRALRAGDVLQLGSSHVPPGHVLPETLRPILGRHWEIGALSGPHSTSEYIQDGWMQEFFAAKWEVHFQSARTGVRLIGPRPRWSRTDGGEAGLHPSNLHDNAYAIGSVDFTGDMPVILGPDGPSLGGFVCPATVAQAELWKLGQLRPGDTVSFIPWSSHQASYALQAMNVGLQALAAGVPAFKGPISASKDQGPVLATIENGVPFPVVIRRAGDAYVLVEYGSMELDLRLRFRAHALMQSLQRQSQFPILDLTPGIRSLQIHYDATRISQQDLVMELKKHEIALPPIDQVKVPSRIVHLPLSWDDPATQLAIDRYQKNVRPDAPWCPSNIEFIRRINGLVSIEDVKKIVFNASYLVLGLGDVYLGAPVAVPLDPRHRLVTTKYNPARTWTPENAVGIGGAYMCIYGMEGPGGYQFVGRTLQVWNRHRSTDAFQVGSPWLLRFFDQIRFYPVGAEELLQYRDDFAQGRYPIRIEETEFDLGQYEQWLQSIQSESDACKMRQQHAFAAERESWKKKGLAEYVAEAASVEIVEAEQVPVGSTLVTSAIPGSIWKILAKEGDMVEAGDSLMIAESMKMEMPIESPCKGIIRGIRVKSGEQIRAGQGLLVIEEA